MQKDRPFLWIFFLAVAATVVSAATLDKLGYSRLDRRAYLTAKQIAFVHPGLDLQVLDIVVGDDRSVSVRFSAKDDRGLPLDRQGITTPGPIAASFILGTIPAGDDKYMSYTTRVQTSPITNVSAVQPSADSGGTFETVATGEYIYHFNTPLPEGFDPDATHTVGIYAERDLTEFGLAEQVDNDVVNFLPSGGPVQVVRDVVRTESCNQCHDPLGVHGGVRRAVELCVMCHYEGVIDPDTGNTIDMRVMIHKIHRGENLPSVEDGTPYQIIGFRQGVNDYSEVVFPRDIRGCTACHSPNAAQANAYLLLPKRDSCGSCHDDVNFMSGENHIGGPQISDNLCANCHIPQGELEFDASILGAHIIETQSAQLEGLNIEFTDIVNTGPGDNPTVFFNVKNNDGETIAPADLGRFLLRIAGPTTDYTYLTDEDARMGAVPSGDGFMYTFDTPLPADAEGSYAISVESRRDVILNPGTTLEFTQREAANDNPVSFFAVTDPAPVPRRMIVDDANCEECHGDLMLHGGNRRNATDYCQMCHQPQADDSPFRPAGETPHTIDFKFLIHRIHRGEELTRDFTITGFNGSQNNYNHVLFPGDLRNCSKCHEGNSFEIPTPGIVSTIDELEFFSPIPPNTTACLGCHDSLTTAAHAFVNIAPFGEACATCHGPNAEFAVSKVHAR